MDSDDIRERLRKQRERWLREREIDKDKSGNFFYLTILSRNRTRNKADITSKFIQWFQHAITVTITNSK